METEIAALYREMWRALISKDISALDRIHADEFVLVHMTGLHQPKAEYLRCVHDGVLNYFIEQTDNVDIRITGNRATLIGQSRVNAAVFGGGRNTWRLQLAFDVERRGRNWILTHGKASTY